MIKQDEDALICDFAEYYRIYDYKALPLDYAAVLFLGLRANSRCKIVLSGNTYGLDTYMSAWMVDALNTLVWFQSRDGQKGLNRPKSLVELLKGDVDKSHNKEKFLSFSSAEEFEKERERRLKKWQQS